ncbi:hypothetical protein BDV18DRAFT_160514 [Aspergillus unguis]
MGSNHQEAKPEPQTNGTNHENEQLSEQQALEQQAAELNEALAYYRTFLTRFFNVVSRGEQAAVDRLIETIRAGASHEEIYQALTELGANDHQLDSS